MALRFPLGHTYATPAVLRALSVHEVAIALARHAAGDWGDVCPEDAAANESSLRCGARLLSVYRSAHGRTFWIITEANRSSTTILLPEDY